MKDFFGNSEQLEELVAYIASQINVPTIGIGGGYAPIGSINFFDATTAPQDWLACDGTVYNIADYPQLADWYEAQHGSKNFYGGDGTTTFAVPDLQGEFLRGTGTNSHANQGSGANVGEHQDGTIVQIGLNVSNLVTPIIESSINADKLIYTNRNKIAPSGTDSGGQLATSRPTNTSFLICVKAVVAGDVYSTEERKVATWIDGKPVYQKTVDFESNLTILGSGVNISQYISALNIDTIINCHGNASNSSNNNNYSVSTHLERSQGAYILYAAGGNNSSWLVRYLTVRYTKTTD